MTTTDFLLQLKYRFRDYFIPVDGKTASLVGLEDLITKFIEDKYIMKIDFKINKEKIVALNQLLSMYDNVEISKYPQTFRSGIVMRKELRHKFVVKTTNCPDKKDFKMSLPYYLANELFETLYQYCKGGEDCYINGLDQLKNDLHRKLL